MTNFCFSPFPVLVTQRLNLRQITEDDLNEFYILKSDERLLKHYDAKARNFEESRQKLLALNRDIAEGDSITWGITHQNDNKLIGSICLWNFSENQHSAEIGYELMVDWQGKGIMQEAIKAVIAYGFNQMHLLRIEAVPNPNHIKSINLLKSNGFAMENVFEEKGNDGNTHPRVLFSLEYADWQSN